MVRRVFKLIFVTFLLLLYAAVLNPCLAHDPKPDNFLQSLTEEERQWLKAHPLIRLGADSDYPPF